jgi:hypothetical protein
VIGRVVTAIEYPAIQFSFRLAVANQKEVVRVLQNGYFIFSFSPNTIRQADLERWDTRSRVLL